MMQGMQQGQQHPDAQQPDAKKAKAEGNLLPEAQWLASNKGRVIIKVRACLERKFP
jgi:hypothetical protein